MTKIELNRMVWTSTRDVRGFDPDRISFLPFNFFVALLRLWSLIPSQYANLYLLNIREYLSAAFDHIDSK